MSVSTCGIFSSVAENCSLKSFSTLLRLPTNSFERQIKSHTDSYERCVCLLSLLCSLRAQERPYIYSCFSKANLASGAFLQHLFCREVGRQLQLTLQHSPVFFQKYDLILINTLYKNKLDVFDYTSPDHLKRLKLFLRRTEFERRFVDCKNHFKTLQSLSNMELA